ncbi:MAG: hypothetical protein WAL45_00130 [Terracidiphilus sp.]
MELRKMGANALGEWMPPIEQTGSGVKAYNSHTVSHAPSIRANASAMYLKRESIAE